MARTETGWTKPLPSADGDYFSRVDEYDKWPTLIRIETGAVYEMGQGGNLRREYAAEDYEYLGPFTAADFEQLTRLREAAEKFVTTYEGKEHQLGNGQALRSFLQFREALAQRDTGEKS